MKLITKKIHIPSSGGQMKLLILRPQDTTSTSVPGPGILWIHGGGYMRGMAGMVHFTDGKMLAEKYGGTVISPEYRLATKAPYPAAMEDCYEALRYMYHHAEELGIDKNRIIVGGESAGGGLTAAVCLYARDQGEVPVFFQIPLYPMLDCQDTDSSRDNHGWIWNTRKNHWGWSHYLGELYGKDSVPAYASPSRESDYSGMPACYTFVADGEPFYDETMTYVQKLKEAGISANIDVYHGNIHAFDLLFWTRNAKKARAALCAAYEKAVIK